MKQRITKRLTPICCSLLLALAGSLSGAETSLITNTTPWRVWMVVGKAAFSGPDGVTPLTEKNAELTRLPAGDWAGARYDDALWGRYEGDVQEWIGLYTGNLETRARHQPTVAYLRTRFGISDPTQATDVNLTIEYVGGIVASVNGQEVGRGHLPAGALQPYTLATAYPVETYTLEDGVTPVPQVRFGVDHKMGDNPRVRQRVRTLNVRVPAQTLVKGANVLALAVYRAPVLQGAPGLVGGRDVWRHQGIGTISLTSASGNGTIAWSEALKGTRVWSAQPLEQVTNERAAKMLADWGRPGGPPSFMTFGLAHGNPFDPLLPVRVVVPRNGVGNGQTVLTDEAGLKDVTASLGPLKGPGGATLKGVQIRYGKQGAPEGTSRMSTGHWCDALAQQPPAGAKTIPVWLEITASKDQTPGEYTGELALAANGKKFTVPVQVLVTGFTAPDPKDFRSVIVCFHSPEATAKQYNLKPYSNEHFQVMEKSLAFMGQLGNDLLTVPVIKGVGSQGSMGHETGLIRWVKTATGLKPDFSLFERYLDLYVKHCGQPKAISLSVWSMGTASETAIACEGAQVPTRVVPTHGPLLVTAWDPQTGATEDIPAPQPTAEGAEAFWKPLLDGVHEIVVKKRGWPEQTILLGVGSDTRPSVKTGELFRKWAPYARWEIVSHFSGDPGQFYKGPPLPGSAPGKFIILGDLEVGLKEAANGSLAGIGDGVSARSMEALVQNKDGFLRTFIQRGGPSMYSSPVMYRTVPVCGHWTRVGMDCWPKVNRNGPGYYIWGEQPIWMTWPGTDGAQPTVRLQMVREGLQDFEARWLIAKKILSLPEAERQAYRALLNEIHTHTGVWGRGDPVNLLPHTALGYDWQDYVARVHAAAMEANCTGRMVDGTPADDPKVTTAIRAETDLAKLLWRIDPLVKAGLEVAQRGPLANTDHWRSQVPVNTENTKVLPGYFAAIDVASDPAAAAVLLKAYPKDWTLYPTFARNLKPEAVLAWLEPIALESAPSGSRARILSAWKAIGKAAQPSMERVKTAMLAKGEADKVAGEYAKAIEETITIIQEK
jgi:hypothetical protein